jgi:hypothetical protein
MPFRRYSAHLAFGLMAFTIGGCDLNSGTHRWKQVNHISGGTRDMYFVVVDPEFARDRSAYEDAAHTLCPSGNCEIAFYATRKEVPAATTFAAFFDTGGFNDRQPRTAYYVYGEFQWDCQIFPQPYLNGCLSHPHPTSATILDTAKSRGPLTGLGKTKFGMKMDELIRALGGPDAVVVVPPMTDGRTVVTVKTAFHGRSYDGFYNVTASKFSVVMLRWSSNLGEGACAIEAKKIANNVAKDFGKEDQFSYYEKDEKMFDYHWLFGNGGTLDLNNVSKLSSDEGDCALTLNFEDSKVEAD